MLNAMLSRGWTDLRSLGVSFAVLQSLTNYWDGVVARWLDGGPAVPDELATWHAGYRGKGHGAVDVDAMPELWHGPLDPTRARVVFLALNPGRSHADYQHRDGVFATEIREEFGSYGRWAASWPYLRQPWEADKGPNRHHRNRLTFARRWFEDPTLSGDSMVSFEMYPWHSTALNTALRPDPAAVRQYVWEPVSALAAPVFAFGAPWFTLLEKGLGLPVLDRLGAGGRDYGSEVPSRRIHVFEAPGGARVIAAKHNGPAGPPSEAETARLRDALG